MEKIKVLFKYNTIIFKDLELAKEVAKRYTMIGGKATVYKGNTKVITYYNGEEM